MGTVGARTERGCLVGHALCGEGLSDLQWVELRLRRVPTRTRRGIRGLPGGTEPVDGRGHEDEDLVAMGLDFGCVARVLNPIFWFLWTRKKNYLRQN